MTTTDRDTHTEQWAYAGLRLARRTGTKRAVWIDQDGEEMYFKPKGHPVVGGVYEHEVSRHGADGVTRYGQGRYLHKLDDADRVAELEAEDRITRHRAEGIALERSDGRKSALDEALEPLLAITAKQIDPAKREALAAYVTRRMYEAAYRKS